VRAPVRLSTVPSSAGRSAVDHPISTSDGDASETTKTHARERGDDRRQSLVDQSLLLFGTKAAATLHGKYLDICTRHRHISGHRSQLRADPHHLAWVTARRNPPKLVQRATPEASARFRLLSTEPACELQNGHGASHLKRRRQPCPNSLNGVARPLCLELHRCFAHVLCPSSPRIRKTHRGAAAVDVGCQDLP
jgi:hypothetical protein